MEISSNVIEVIDAVNSLNDNCSLREYNSKFERLDPNSGLSVSLQTLLFLNKSNVSNENLYLAVLRSFFEAVISLDICLADRLVISTKLHQNIPRVYLKLVESEFINFFRYLEDNEIVAYSKGKSITAVNVIVPNVYRANSTHLNSVVSYLFCLASCSQIESVNVIFTLEWNGKLISQNLLKAKRRQEIVDYFKQIAVNLGATALINKIHVNMLSPLGISEQIVNGPIIKFKGAAYRNATYIYEKELYNKFPVSTVTFSSQFTNTSYTDLLLTRYSSVQGKCIHYVPPIMFNLLTRGTIHAVKELVTAFSQDRIESSLKLLEEEDWAILDNLLDDVVSWRLIGIPEKSLDIVKNLMSSNLSPINVRKVKVESFQPLETMFAKNSVFFILPNINGGGGTATFAMTQGIPVVMIKNSSSDISNNCPEKNLSNSLFESCEKIRKLVFNTDYLSDFIFRQNDLLQSRSDIRGKGRELLAIIERTEELFLSRRKVND